LIFALLLLSIYLLWWARSGLHALKQEAEPTPIGPTR
jgi:hypothetical protein